MTSYQDLYKTGILHLETDLTDILNSLQNGESVCLSSALQMGDVRLMDYLAYKLEHCEQFEVFYDHKDALNTTDLKELVGRERETRLVLILPYYSYKTPDFKQAFQQQMNLHAEEVLSVIRMYYDFLLQPEQFFDKSTRPISYVKIRKPLNLDLTSSVIKSRESLNGWTVPTKKHRQIHQLSGGVVGLIKQLCSYHARYGELELEKLLYYPPIVRILADLKLAFDRLNSNHLQQLGLVDDQGIIRGKLLDAYLKGSKVSDQFQLSPSQQLLFDHLLKHTGQIVPMDHIEDLLSQSSDYSFWGVYKMISRLKDRIKSKYILRNVKGQGYVLTERHD